MNLFKLSGVISIVCGVACCILLFYPTLLPFTFLFTIIAYLFSTINIYLNAKYEITKSNFSIGYIGLILASFPVIFVLTLIVKHH